MSLKITNLLKEFEFKTDEVVGIQECVFRPSQNQVIFQKEVKLGLEEIENKMKGKKLPYSAAKFAYCEEILMVYGLPFVNDIGKIKEELKDSVRAFV